MDSAGRGDTEAVDIEPEAVPEPAAGRLDFTVVGIGASAGGLAALDRFFERMPSKCGMAFVVILHLSPKHESNAAAILQRSTKMPVRQVVRSTSIEVDHVYVAPPAAHLAMEGGRIRLVEQARLAGRHVAIDLFFRALAQAHQERSVAVVLSGSGADGAVGLTRIKERGGVTFAQDPDDAEYDGMPLAAVGTGNVDIVLPVAEIPQRLFQLVESARMIRLPPPTDSMLSHPAVDRSDAAEAALVAIKALVSERTGHDFTHYKRATVIRRIERRLQVTGLKALPEYRDFVDRHPEELRALLADLLISVTNFFRDRDAFEALEREVLPTLFDRRTAAGPIRVWVAGCATGEEAYSIAMQLHDWCDEHSVAADFEVFATDIDERALASARTGLYPLSIATDVPAQRLRRYFRREGDRYRVVGLLQERVLFARHNVLQDQPFPRIDVVSCRHLLIYLDREAQRRVLDSFRLALGSNGFLFVGASETTEASGHAFAPVDKKHRIYRPNPGAGVARPVHGAVGTATATRQPVIADGKESRFESLHRQAMERYASPSVLIDASHQIVHLSAGAGRFLEHAGGEPSHNIVTIVHRALQADLRTALSKSSRTGRSVGAQAVPMRRDGHDVFVNILVRPYRGSDSGAGLSLVFFEEVDEVLRPAAAAPAAPATGNDAIVEQLEAELKRQRTYLQDSLERSEASSEALKASNEELHAINEEFRSASDELETGKEELQSMNEELIGVNYQLRVKIDQVGKINDDLQNLIASTDIAMIFVDSGLRIKRYTPRALDLFNLIPTDVGRSLLDIRHRLDYDELADDAAASFRTLGPIEREVGGDNGNRYLARLLPYRTTADRIDGATIAFVDVTSLRRAEAQIREDEAHLRLAAATTKDFAIMTMDDVGHITTWNKGAERMFGYTEQEIIGRPSAILFTPEDRAAGVPELELTTARTTGRAEDDRWHLRKDNTRFFCSGVVTPFESGEMKGLAKIARDVTGLRREQTARDALLVEERAARAQYEASSRLKDEFLAVMSHELKHPLNLIHVNAELLTRMPQVREIPAVQRAAQTIRQSVVTQGKIIDDLLDLSRVRTGKLTLQVEPVDLAAVIETVVIAVRADADAKRIELAYHADNDLGLVTCDSVRVEQIAWNLLSNALKFTPRGGRLDVRLEADGSDVRFSVTDSGRGISAAFLPHVFDMFRQDPHGSGGGLGIGLALVRELALAHGGRVEAHSDGADRGARFTVWLPFSSPGSNADRGLVSGLGRSLEGLRVLVVEDSRQALEPFVELLRLEGALPTASLDGRDAIALLDRQDFDLIISDIGMPDLGGYEFIAAVRRHPRAATVPAIALTGYGRNKDKQHALEAGFDAHVPKPASLDDIRRVVAGLPTVPSASAPPAAG